MKKVLTVIVSIIAAVSVLAGCSASSGAASSGNVIKIGVRKNLANFSSYNEDAGTYYGFEDDLAAYIAVCLGYDGAELIGVDPEERESALENGEIDCLIAAYSYTEERAGKFDLSEPYYYDSGRVMIEKSTLFTDYADLEGAVVAVRKGTDAGDNLAQKLVSDGLIKQASDMDSFLELVEYESYEEMNSALEYGDVDALCSDGCITLPWLNDERTYFEEAYSEEQYVIATIKGSDLTAKIASALSQLKENGTITRLEIKWGIADEEE